MIITVANPGTERLRLKGGFNQDFTSALEGFTVDAQVGQTVVKPKEKRVLGLNPDHNLGGFMASRGLTSFDQITDDRLAALRVHDLNELCFSPCNGTGGDPNNQVINFIARVAKYFQKRKEEDNLIAVLAKHFRAYASNYGSRRNSPIEPLKPVLNKMTDNQIGDLLAATVEQKGQLPISTTDGGLLSTGESHPNIGLSSVLTYARQRLGDEDDRVHKATLKILTLEAMGGLRPSPNEEMISEELCTAIPEDSLREALAKKEDPSTLHTLKLLLKRFGEEDELVRLSFARFLKAEGTRERADHSVFPDSIKDRVAEVFDTMSPDTQLAIANKLLEINPGYVSDSYGSDPNAALSWLYNRLKDSQLSPEQKATLTLDILKLTQATNAGIVFNDLTLVPEDDLVAALPDLPPLSLYGVFDKDPYPDNAEIRSSRNAAFDKSYVAALSRLSDQAMLKINPDSLLRAASDLAQEGQGLIAAGNTVVSSIPSIGDSGSEDSAMYIVLKRLAKLQRTIVGQRADAGREEFNQILRDHGVHDIFYQHS